MKNRYEFLKIKARLSLKTVMWIMSKWRYAIAALLISIFFFELIYWVFNLNIFWSVISSTKISLFDKLSFMASPLESVVQLSGYASAITMMLLSITQGISIAILIFIIRHQKKVDSEMVGRSSLIGILAIIGLGCPACGTSLLTPIIAIFVSGSAVTVSEQITIITLPIALLISIYGLYTLGLKGATVKVMATTD